MSTEHRYVSHLDVLAEANDQFHWGTKVEDVEQAALRLRQVGANPAFVNQLEAKAVRMKTDADLLPNKEEAVGNLGGLCSRA